jgi:hypothetical protein
MMITQKTIASSEEHEEVMMTVKKDEIVTA